MLDDIDFMQANWAYLILNEDGSYRLKYKEKKLLENRPSPIWAPLVNETEIVYDRWHPNGEYRYGVWNGRNVEAFIPWEGGPMSYMADAYSEGYRLWHCLGLDDLTYAMFGHIVRDGKVVGIVREAAYGRPIIYSDRAAVYQAVARIQSKGTIFRGLQACNMYIADGGVRFTSLSSVLHPDEILDFDMEAERWHSRYLEIVFNELKATPSESFIELDSEFASMEIVLPRLPSPRNYNPDLPDTRHIRTFSIYLLAEEIYLQEYGTYLRSVDTSNDSTKTRSKTLSKLLHAKRLIYAQNDEPFNPSLVMHPIHRRVRSTKARLEIQSSNKKLLRSLLIAPDVLSVSVESKDEFANRFSEV